MAIGPQVLSSIVNVKNGLSLYVGKAEKEIPDPDPYSDQSQNVIACSLFEAYF